MKRTISTLCGISCLLAGCVGAATGGGSSITVKPGTTVAAKGRSVEFAIRAPAGLGSAGGKLISDDIAGIVAQGGGNIVAQGGGNIVASGGGNLVARSSASFRAPTFSLFAVNSGFAFVAKAGVQVEGLDGVRVGKNVYTTSDDGTVTLTGVPDGKPLVAVARYKLKDKVYRVSAMIGAGPISTTLQVDPINSFVQARVREILKKSGKSELVTPTQLAAVWTSFNESEIQIPDKLLEIDATETDLLDFYKESIPKLSCAGQDSVKKYMLLLGAEPPASPPPACTPAPTKP